jgi:hypothetical protein
MFIHVPCAVPPCDQTIYTGSHARRDAERAAKRTRIAARSISDNYRFVGDWLIKHSPWMSVFTNPVSVFVTNIHLRAPGRRSCR